MQPRKSFGLPSRRCRNSSARRCCALSRRMNQHGATCSTFRHSRPAAANQAVPCVRFAPHGSVALRKPWPMRFASSGAPRKNSIGFRQIFAIELNVGSSFSRTRRSLLARKSSKVTNAFASESVTIASSTRSITESVSSRSSPSGTGKRSIDRIPDHPVIPAGRRLALVLRRRDGSLSVSSR
jgi:hypothetical protein